ncbi:hypothetical protein RCO48_18375 [Peribacillus frigoritolerans]|nr:hypothetical protein [Peribacillus frigoritolerans]
MMKNSRLGIGRTRTAKVIRRFSNLSWSRERKTSLMGGGAREAEDADQALASIQGSSGESQQKEYNQQETLEKKQTNMGKSGEHPFGEENKDVVQVIKEAKVPTVTEEKRYREFVADIEPFKRKLSSTIEKTLENKKNAPRKDLVFWPFIKEITAACI